MLGIKFIREHKEAVKKAIVTKGVNLNLDDLLVKDDRKRCQSLEILNC